MRFGVCVFLLILFNSYTLIGQDLSYHLFDSDKGLPGNEVYDLLRDKNGEIWGSTDGGVFHYNGTEFETYTTSNGLTDNAVLKIYEDSLGRIWMSGFNGSICYLKNKKVYALPCNKELQMKIKGGIIYSLWVDQKNRLWVGSTNGFYKIDLATFKVLKVESLKKDPNYFDFYLKYTKNKYFFSSTYVRHFNQEKVRFVLNDRLILDLDLRFKHLYLNSTIQAFDQLPNGNYLISCGRCIIEFNEHGLVRYKVYTQLVNSFALIGNDLWVAVSNQGLMIYPNANINSEPENYLLDYSLSSFQVDLEGGVWVGVIGKGLLYIPNRNCITFSKSNSLNSMPVSFCKSNNDMYVLTDMNEVFMLDSLYAKKQIIGKGSKIDKGNIVKDHNSIVVTSASSFEWIPSLKKVKPFQYNGYSLASYDMVKKDHGKLVFLCYERLCLFEENVLYDIIDLPVRGQCLFSWGSRLLIGTVNGLYEMSGNKVLALWPRVFKNLRVNAITQYKHYLVFSTMQKGVVMINTKNNKVHYYNTKSGLPVQAINYALFYNEQLWVSSKTGFFKVDFKTFPIIQNVRRFDESDGLASRETGKFTFHNNKLWLATRKGLCIIKDIGSMDNEIPPDVFFVSSQVGDKKYFSASFMPVFSYNQNNIKVEVGTSSYRNKTDHKFRYKLEGFNEKYEYTSSGVLNFPNLNPGQYALTILALNNHGLQSKPLVFSFEISPPFWKKVWFIFSVILVGIIILYVFIKWRIGKEKIKQDRENEIQRVLYESRMQAIRAQMNPHFIFNAINSIQGYVLQNKSDEAYHYLTRFSQLIRMVLDNSKEDMLTLQHELDLLQLYVELEQLRFNNRFVYNVSVSKEISSNELPFPVMILQPLVENAIWHGLMPQQQEIKLFIKIDIQKLGEYLVIVITDNGVGYDLNGRSISSNASKKSLGLQLVHDRLKLLDKTAELFIAPLELSGGTVVKITLSLSSLYESVAD